MKIIGIGLLLMFIAVLMLLDQLNVLALSGWFEYLWIALVFLIGFEMLLSQQRVAAERKVEKRKNKEQEKMKKELSHDHMKSQQELKQELKKKEAVVNEQEEIIDDMINPKI